MSLVWRHQLSVGNDVIDNDHKHLIGIINSVERGLEARDQARLNAALDELSKYSMLHFAREEKIATAAGYTQIPHLNDSHMSLLKELEQVRGEFDAMGKEWEPEVASHFTNFLRNWLIDHVIKEDLLMKPSLEKYPPSFNPG